MSLDSVKRWELLHSIANYIESIKEEINESSYTDADEKIILLDGVSNSSLYDLISKVTWRKFIYSSVLAHENDQYWVASMKITIWNDWENLLRHLPVKMDSKLTDIYQERIETIIHSWIWKCLNAVDIENFTVFLWWIDSWKIENWLLKSEYIEFIIDRMYNSTKIDENKNMFESWKYIDFRDSVLKKMAIQQEISIDTLSDIYHEHILLVVKELLEQIDFFEDILIQKKIDLSILKNIPIDDIKDFRDLKNHIDEKTICFLRDSIARPMIDSLVKIWFIAIERDIDWSSMPIVTFSSDFMKQYYLNKSFWSDIKDLEFFIQENYRFASVEQILDWLLFNNSREEYVNLLSRLESLFSSGSIDRRLLDLVWSKWWSPLKQFKSTEEFLSHFVNSFVVRIKKGYPDMDIPNIFKIP